MWRNFPFVLLFFAMKVDSQDFQYQDNEGDIAANINEVGGDLFETIPGAPHVDYPTYQSIPRTSFSCKGRVHWGYYADIETACQAFHICENEYSKISFLCPVGSAFNPQHLVCDWWYNFDCQDAISLMTLFDEYADVASDSDPAVEKTKRAGKPYRAVSIRHRPDEDFEDEVQQDDNGLYDLNSASSGGIR